jgi:two-component system, chemotaxis family, response regulator PixG
MTIVAGNCEISETLTPEQLIERLRSALHSPPSGILALTNLEGQAIGSLRFQQDQLLWASGGQHRWRRWRRLTQQQAPQLGQLGSKRLALSDDWEYQTLTLAVQQQQLSQETAIALLESNLVEALFDILQACQGGCRFSTVLAPTDQSSIPLLGLHQGLAQLNQAQQHWQSWQTAGLGQCSPDATPTIRNAAALQQRTSPQTYQTLTSLLNGQSSLRELAVLMQQDLQMLAQTLLAYSQWHLIGLDPLADIAAPSQANSPPRDSAQGDRTQRNIAQKDMAQRGLGQPPASPFPGLMTTAAPSGPPSLVPTSASNSAEGPLIMCIDDNPKVCEMLGKILFSAGYRFIAVQDSLQALPVLLENKPEFVFLDLVMPVASGYEVCSQIRRISSFKEIPIVILTGNDGIIDRIRAKASGSTDFISKPLDVSKVLATLKRYLPQRVPEATP